MRRSTLISWFACFLAAACAGVAPEQPSSGSVEFATSADSPEPPSATSGATAPCLVVTEQGREVGVRWLALTARDSANGEFVLCFEPIDGFDDDVHEDLGQSGWRSLVIRQLDGVETKCHGHGFTDPSARGFAKHHFVFVTADLVAAVGAAVGLVPARYVRRDAALETEFELLGGKFSIGQPVDIRVRITNASGAALLRSTSSPGGQRSSWWQLVARRAGVRLPQLPARTDDRSRRGTTLEWPDGSTIESVERVDEWFALDEPGTYEIEVEYRQCISQPLPTFSSEAVCPTAQRLCTEVLPATLRFTLTR
ncbi:MAG: hypothetical protein HZA52_12290 [Planctomycetes bacterium]|nr:hypothetical protein [Planctomycetota bacterium]